ncbi:MAG: ECF-type sigma factor [Pseudomonadota bacterium]
MVEDSGSTVNQLLERWNLGDRQAHEALLARVYPALKAIAARALAAEPAGLSLQPTALVNEAYLKLVDLNRVDWRGRSHFLALAGQVMRQILVDQARHRGAAKRSWGRRVTFTGSLAEVMDSAEVLILDQALTELASEHGDLAQVVELRVFGGLTIEETAVAMGTSTPTVKRRWRSARAWLLDWISNDQ